MQIRTTNGQTHNLIPLTNELTESLEYDNPHLGFTLEYPVDWTKEESLSFVVPLLMYRHLMKHRNL